MQRIPGPRFQIECGRVDNDPSVIDFQAAWKRSAIPAGRYALINVVRTVIVGERRQVFGDAKLTTALDRLTHH
ncbi:hypothetical protein [Sphingosinicella microcystinivorans]|uniref:hypothetical protein n=1 Tax=Sphingosinicella microcystinivorans TaxID=335406 RepID=UPI001474B915|nr:hypothetical protein [Sphingosinicella microcystinivorans]